MKKIIAFALVLVAVLCSMKINTCDAKTPNEIISEYCSTQNRTLISDVEIDGDDYVYLCVDEFGHTWGCSTDIGYAENIASKF